MVGAIIFSITTISKTILSIARFSLTTFSKMTLSITAINISID